MGLGDTIVVPVISPSSAAVLSDFAARLAIADSGLVVPMSVAAASADAEHIAAAEALLREAENAATAAGSRAQGQLVRHSSVAEAVLETVAGVTGTLTVMGWQGIPPTPPPQAPAAGGSQPQGRVFGQLIDSIIGRAGTPLAVVRHADNPFDRILLPIAEDALLPGGLRGVGLAADLADRLARSVRAPVTLLRAGPVGEPLPDRILALSDRVHHDPRRVDRALASAVRDSDLVVVPVDPTASGLRAATTQVAWASSKAWLVLAVDAVPAPEGDLADAVRLAGTPPPEEPAEVAGLHEVVVTIGCREDTPSDEAFIDALRTAGTVTDFSAWVDRRGRSWRQAAVQVDGRSASAAVGAVMDLLAASEAFAHADITYDVSRARGPR